LSISYIASLPYIGRSLLSPTLLSTWIFAAIFDKRRFCTRDGVRIAKSSAEKAGIFEWFKPNLHIIHTQHNKRIPPQTRKYITTCKSKRNYTPKLRCQLRRMMSLRITWVYSSTDCKNTRIGMKIAKNEVCDVTHILICHLSAAAAKLQKKSASLSRTANVQELSRQKCYLLYNSPPHSQLTHEHEDGCLLDCNTG
jgi:hypothetical protein